MMGLSFLNGEEALNEHQIAWRGQQWDSVKKLADSFKQDDANEFFFILNQLNQTKQRLNVDLLDNYSPFNVNSNLSRHIDCIFHVYEMNLLGDSISEQMHYDYLLHAVRSGKRFKGAEDIKDPIEEMVEKVFVACVAKLFEVNTIRATEYIEHHFDETKIAILKKRVWPMVTEQLIKETCPYAKKADMNKVIKEVEAWYK
ncbi:MAG: DNA polymerase clamp loader subunit A [Cetobacterium sp.]|uniref:DNA polymerase clamp loader subunit A n=1 Tax=Cetobacterium sp. TaxID=2071632 RepID=UPI003EE6AE25